MTNQLKYEDVAVGQLLPVLRKSPNTRQLVMWAGATEEFYELHYDKDFAQSKGLPGVIVHGMLLTSFLGQLLTDWIGDLGTIKKLRVNYLSMVFPGQDLVCKGVVARKYVENNEELVSCDIWIEKVSGEKTVSGEAIVSLPAGAYNE
jgi:acyl dehydratase